MSAKRERFVVVGPNDLIDNAFRELHVLGTEVLTPEEKAKLIELLSKNTTIPTIEYLKFGPTQLKQFVNYYRSLGLSSLNISTILNLSIDQVRYLNRDTNNTIKPKLGSRRLRFEAIVSQRGIENVRNLAEIARQLGVTRARVHQYKKNIQKSN